MKDKLSEFVPLRDTPLALVYSLLWLVALWAFQTPADERIVVCVLAYTTLWMSRLVVANLVEFLLSRLYRYTLRVADTWGIEVPDDTYVELSPGARIVLALFVIAAVSGITGLAFSIMTPIGYVMGLSPLGGYFNIAGWVLLGLGALILTILFVVAFATFAVADSLTYDPKIPLNRIERTQVQIRQLAV